jgi:hypothetical protein
MRKTADRLCLWLRNGGNYLLNQLFYFCQPAKGSFLLNGGRSGIGFFGSKPEQGHCHKILHVFTSKLGFKFPNFLVNKRGGFAYFFFIRFLNTDPIVTVGNNNINR